MAGSERLPAPNSVLDGRVRPLTLGLPLVVTLFAFDNLGVTTVMPRVAHDLSGLSLYGWAFSAFTLASIVGLVEAGRRADRRGPAPGLSVGLGLFVVGLITTASAPDMPVVMAGRALQGLGSGAFGTTMYVVIGRAYPEALRPRMFAVLSTAWVVPSLVGPALAGFVADSVGWRAVFAGLAV
ncbi:MAG TPA: MFS transporter, partial [Acidimicrobiales bacterium]|nr:MFS transporter [Acidimicrobiales bacterium]